MLLIDLTISWTQILTLPTFNIFVVFNIVVVLNVVVVLNIVVLMKFFFVKLMVSNIENIDVLRHSTVDDERLKRTLC